MGERRGNQMKNKNLFSKRAICSIFVCIILISLSTIIPKINAINIDKYEVMVR